MLTYLVALACLACNTVAAAPQETARALIERGAYAEEHERNFDAALELYAKAAKAAADAGDAATATEANAARDRVLARQGKAPAQASPADEQLVMRRALATVSSATEGAVDINQAAETIAIFGNRVVQWLEPMLVWTERIPVSSHFGSSFGPDYLTPNAPLAALALVRIATPEAKAALERGLASPDPTVRMAIIKSLNVFAHADMAKRMVLDPVPAVSSVAIELLAGSQDLGLTDVMDAAARKGSWQAMEWLVRKVPERVLAIAIDRGATVQSRSTALQQLRSGGRVSPKIENVRALLAIGLDGDEASLRFFALVALSEQVPNWSRPQDSALQEEAAKLITAQLEHELSPQLITAVNRSQSVPTIKAMTALIPKLVAQPDAVLLNDFNVWLNNAQGEYPPATFDAWLAMYRALPIDFPRSPDDRNTDSSALAKIARQLGIAAATAPPDVIARSGRSLEGEARKLYDGVILARLRSETRKANSRGGGGWPPAGSIDRAVLPLALELIATAGEGGAPTDAFAALIGIGDVQQIGVALDYIASREENMPAGPAQAVEELTKVDAKAAAVVFSAHIESVLASAAPTKGQLTTLGMLRVLPDESALAVIRTSLPKARSDDAKEVLFSVLINYVRIPAATAFIAEHYTEMPSAPRALRAAAITRFGRELYEPAINLLGSALKDTEEDVRRAAREASQAFKVQREALEEFAAWTSASKEARDSIAELSKLLESNNKDVVLGAIKALGAVKARTALPALVKLLERNDPEVKAAVQDAIAKIGS